MRTISDITFRLTPIFEQYRIKKAVLFGSYANGTATEKSDVDILVDSQLRGWDFYGFWEDIHQAAGKTIDLIDICEVVKDSRIDKEIQRTGQVIYEKAG